MNAHLAPPPSNSAPRAVAPTPFQQAQPLAELPTPTAEDIDIVPAGLERRFLAWALDRTLVWVPAVAALVVLRLVLDLSWLVCCGVAVGIIAVVSLVLAVCVGVAGVSPGKALTGLRVWAPTGGPIGVGRALHRGLITGLAGPPTLGMAGAALAWTALHDASGRRRGWHDVRCGSVVADARPVEERVAEVDTPELQAVVNLTAMRLVPAPAEPVVAPPSVRPARGSSPALPVPPPPEALSSPSGVSLAPPVPPAPAQWRVRFDDGQSFVVEGPVLVGRSPSPTHGEQVRHIVPLLSNDMSVSKTHAAFGPMPEGGLAVVDRGSTNGTVLVRAGVSRALAPGRSTALLEGDVVAFGDRSMTVSREA